jgi:trehalose 6-phosphate phosphatase
MDALTLLAKDPSTAGLIVDFDGTLSPIVDRPEDALPAEGAPEILEALAERYALVAVLSGRPLEFLKSRFPRSRVLLCGAYGRERSDRTVRRMTEGWEPVAAAAVAATSHLDGVLVERKVNEIALALAKEFELEIMPGRLVAELVVPGPKKGDAVRELVAERALTTVLVAGDDLADIESFTVVRELGVSSIAIAVLSEEAPQRLIDAADETVSGPAELVELLRGLLTR